MSRARKRLGRGLGAILGGDGEVETIRELSVNQIRPNPHQPRRAFDEEALQELADSIRVHGVVQPVIVVADGDLYTLVAGERRWRAAQLAGLERIPAIIRNLDSQGMTEVALIENLQRADLTPIEEAYAYKMLQEEFSLTQEAIAKRVGKSRSQVANTLRLLTLDPEIQRQVDEGLLTMGHAKLLLSVADGEKQKNLARRAIEEGWTVRELGNQLEKDSGGTGAARAKAQSKSRNSNEAMTDPHWRAAAENIQRALATRVHVHPGRDGRRGRITLEFYGLDDFDRLYRMLTSIGQ